MSENPVNSQNNTPKLPKSQDPTSIYFIHPSENPATPLVSERFDGERYSEWKRSMIIALSAKNKLAFVDGDAEKPDESHEDYKAWERCNHLVISFILRSLSNDLARSVLYYTTAREMWLDLEERYGQTSGPQLYALQRSLADLEQGKAGIAEFFTKIKAIWDQINGINPIPVCTCNGCTCNLTQKFLKTQQEERLVQMLMKLDDQYANARSNLLMMQPLPNISLAYRLLVQDEKQRAASQAQGESSNAMAFATDHRRDDHRKNENRPYRPPISGSQGQTSNYRTSSGPRRSNYFCDHCNVPGHSRERCWKLNGYPTNFQAGSKFRAQANNKGKRVVVLAQEDDEEDTEPQAYISMQEYKRLKSLEKQKQEEIAESSNSNAKANVAGICLISTLNAKWIIDSGATHQICANLELFETYEKYKDAHSSITVADGKRSTVKHIGTVNLGHGIILQNVMHVPGFKFNLISTHQLCKDLNCSIIFTHDKCILQGPSQKDSLVLGELKSGLYAAVEENSHKPSSQEYVAVTGVNSQCSEEGKL